MIGAMGSGQSNYQALRFRVICMLKEKGLLTVIVEDSDLNKSTSKAISWDSTAFTILTVNVGNSQITDIQEWSTGKGGMGRIMDCA